MPKGIGYAAKRAKVHGKRAMKLLLSMGAKKASPKERARKAAKRSRYTAKRGRV